MGNEHRRVFTCPQCGGTQLIVRWKRAYLDDDPDVREIRTTENCPICDGAGQILGALA